MQTSDFIQIVMRGPESEALAALRQQPDLASARSPQGVSAVCLAVYRRAPALAAALAELRSELDLFEAACLGDTAAVLRIVAPAPESVNAVSPDGFSALGYSAFFGHLDLLRALIARGAKVDVAASNAMRVCPLHSAAACADQVKAVELARMLLEAGADPNPQQQGGFTPLHEAAANGNLALIDLLIEHGASRVTTNEAGATALDLARSNGHTEAARLLGA